MIQTAIQKLLPLIKGVVATEQVHDHLPLKADNSLDSSATLADGRLHFYTVLRPSANIATRGGNLVLWDHRIDIEGRVAYQGSETIQLLDNEVDSILIMLSQQPTIKGTVQGFQRLVLAENKPYAFFNGVVHYARIEIEVRI